MKQYVIDFTVRRNLAVGFKPRAVTCNRYLPMRLRRIATIYQRAVNCISRQGRFQLTGWARSCFLSFFMLSSALLLQPLHRYRCNRSGCKPTAG